LRDPLPFLFSLRRPVTWRSRLERPPPLFFLPLTRGEGIRFVAVLLLRCAEIEFSRFLETKDSETRSAMDLLHCLSGVVGPQSSLFAQSVSGLVERDSLSCGLIGFLPTYAYANQSYQYLPVCRWPAITGCETPAKQQEASMLDNLRDVIGVLLILGLLLLVRRLLFPLKPPTRRHPLTRPGTRKR